MKLHVLTAVWGEGFIRSFCRLTVRTLMAPGNLADIAADHQVRYTIFTTPEDIHRLKHDPAFQCLAATVDIRLVPFSPLKINTHLSSSHWDLWHKGLRMARQAGEMVITVAADHVFSSGTFTRWVELFDKGYHAIYCPGIQVVHETVAPELETRFPDMGGAMDLPRNDLHQLIIRHLHPSNIVMMRDSPRTIGHPEYIMRAMEGGGIAMRILASHAVCIDPNHFRLREDFCPLDKMEDIAFEPCSFASAEPLMKNLQEYYYPWKIDDAAISNFGRWMHVFSSPANRRESERTHFLDFTSKGNEAAHRRADHASAAYITQMNLSRGIYRLWRGLRDHGLGEAARWLAAAHMCGRLRRGIVLKSPATVFIPSNRALGNLDHRVAAGLLKRSALGLRSVLRDHITLSSEVSPGIRRLRMNDSEGMALLSGRHALPARDGDIKILRGPIQIDNFTIYVIDRPLTKEIRTTPAAVPAVLVSRFYDSAALSRALCRRAARHIFLRLAPLRKIIHPLIAILRQRGKKPIVANDSDTHTLLGLLSHHVRDTLNQVFQFYQSRVLAHSGIFSEPGRLVERNAPGSSEEARHELEEVLASSPTCAEAHYEHACILEKNREMDAAIAAYARAAGGTPLLPKGAHDIDIRVISAMAQSRLLSKRGKIQDAYDALDAVNTPPLPWRYHYARGVLLASLERPFEALDAFNDSLAFDRVVPSLPWLPRRMEESGIRQRSSS